ERRRSADGADDRAEGEERCELALLVVRLAVAAVDRQAVRRESRDEHADILDAARLRELAQAAGEHDTAHVGADRKAGEVHVPARRIEGGCVGCDVEPELQVVDGSGQTEERDTTVEEQRNALEVVILRGNAEADLLDVERTEALLDREPPRSVTVAGTQRHLHRIAAVLLDRERRTERRRWLVTAAARIRQETLCDRIAARRSAERDRQLAQLHLHTAALLGRADAAEAVQGDRTEGQPHVQQGTVRATDAQADAVDRDGRLERVAARRLA